MTNREIELRLATLIKSERQITNEIIELIALAKERKLYLERGYPDLMKWLVKEYGYSHAAAYRRIQAAELKRSVPEITTMLEEGKLIRQFRLRKDPLLKENAKDHAVGVRESDPNVRSREYKDSKCEPSSELSPLVPNAASSGPAESESASALQRVPGRSSVRRLVIQRANGCCEYRDPETGRVCGSRLQVEVDHHVPRALGGTNDINNLRCLCRKHNALMAEKMLGKDRANAWRLEVRL